MLSGLPRVLEVGCADAFGTRLVQQERCRVTAVDFDPVFIRDARERMDPDWPLELRVHDLLAGPVEGPFDGAYTLDVLEHIPAAAEHRFVANLVRSLTPEGVLIVGTPSLQSQAYASPPSRAGHVNCKDAPALKGLLRAYFHNVFIFSMNDEVVHTGFTPMAHYLLALCCGPTPAGAWPAGTA
jgi:2-polyprenyl-3-methyl-5-hydroxy-6-metoxy-1,4-benzoquinol methylase